MASRDCLQEAVRRAYTGDLLQGVYGLLHVVDVVARVEAYRISIDMYTCSRQ